MGNVILRLGDQFWSILMDKNQVRTISRHRKWKAKDIENESPAWLDLQSHGGKRRVESSRQTWSSQSQGSSEGGTNCRNLIRKTIPRGTASGTWNEKRNLKGEAPTIHPSGLCYGELFSTHPSRSLFPRVRAQHKNDYVWIYEVTKSSGWCICGCLVTLNTVCTIGICFY